MIRSALQVNLRLGTVVRPEVLLLLPVALSALAWFVPGQSTELRGFASRSALTPLTIFIVAAWYAACFGVLRLGTSVGARIKPWRVADAASEHQRERLFYLTLTGLAVLGVGSAMVTAVVTGAFAEAMTTSNGNALNASIGARAGISTLRYTSAVAAPYAVWLLLRGVARWPSVLLNVLLMLVNTSFSSRLTLALAFTAGLYLFAKSNPGLRIRLVPALLVGSAGFALLAIFNWLRNSNYYEHLGISNPLAMNYFQIASYLGAPFQVSLGMANAVVRGALLPQPGWLDSLQIVVPSFLRQHPLAAADQLGVPAHEYPSTVDVALNLTTNSTFADTLADFGWVGLVLALLVLGLAGLVYGRSQRYDSRQLLQGAVALYGIAETWRIFLYTQGIFVYLLLAVLLADLVARACIPGSRRGFLSRADRVPVGLRGSRGVRKRNVSAGLGLPPSE